jgi:tRNA1(Val) A37 N6-methylase TrmN6
MHCGYFACLQVQSKSSVFRFRHFDLAHGKCAQKMGTDSMLLGAWTQPPPETRSVLDVGTGTGGHQETVD